MPEVPACSGGTPPAGRRLWDAGLHTATSWESQGRREAALFTLEPIGEDDFEFRYQVYESTVKPYLDETMGWTGEQHRAAIRSNLAGSTTHFAVVVDGVRAGIVRIVERDETITLEQIEILPEFQGEGIGTALIGSLIERSRLTGCPIDLSVFIANLDARRLYERLGLKMVSESDRDIRMRYTPAPGTS